MLRNEKIDPPVLKLMKYRNEVLKKLFEKLGRNFETDNKKGKKGEVTVLSSKVKPKSFRLSTSISVHDLEYKKQKAYDLLENTPRQIVKFYMKVNIYDDENVQKGRLMLLNIAEDLKDVCAVTVQPGKAQ